MFRKISLWDLFVSFGLGLLTLISLFTHFLIVNYNTPTYNHLLVIIEKTFNSTLSILFFLIPIIFVIGFIMDAISNKLIKLVENIFKLKEESKEIKALANLIKNKYMPNYEEIKSYDWCKNYILQNELETPFMAFLSKFGFYRGAACILFINGIFTIIYYPIINSQYLIPIFIGVVISISGYILLQRSKEFYKHMDKCVYINYLISIKNTKLNSRSLK